MAAIGMARQLDWAMAHIIINNLREQRVSFSELDGMAAAGLDRHHSTQPEAVAGLVAAQWTCCNVRLGGRMAVRFAARRVRCRVQVP
jgi:hypothetical protein